MTLFAAQTDFSEPGELGVFISPSQVAMLEAQMWKQGVLDSKQMGAAFQLLRTYDLLWSPAISTYVKGERTGLNDLMAWNADGTRMAWRMHSDYLRQLYLNNDLAEGRYVALGEELDLADITVPDVRGRHRDRPRRALALGVQGRTADPLERLHVLSHERWPQRRHHQRAASIRSAVTACARPRRAARLPSAEKFLETVEPAQGSWWPTWAQWLKTHSTARKVPPPAMGAAKKGYKPLGDAPGTYVHVK